MVMLPYSKKPSLQGIIKLIHPLLHVVGLLIGNSLGILVIVPIGLVVVGAVNASRYLADGKIGGALQRPTGSLP